jgi:hypothetical protein
VRSARHASLDASIAEPVAEARGRELLAEIGHEQFVGANKRRSVDHVGEVRMQRRCAYPSQSPVLVLVDGLSQPGGVGNPVTARMASAAGAASRRPSFEGGSEIDVHGLFRG